MKIPKHIQVGPIRYTVRQGAEAIRTKEREMGHALCGSHSYGTSEIVLSGSMAADVVRDTLMHEVLHAVDTTFGILDLDANATELVINRFSTTLLDTLRRNPALVAYLMERKS